MNTTESKTVNWHEPIEYVPYEGRIEPAKVKSIVNDGAIVEYATGVTRFCRDDGRAWVGHDWSIAAVRNVAVPDYSKGVLPCGINTGRA